MPAEIVYDNSADNVHNPNTPPKRIRWGLDSTDEMGAITFALSPANENDAEALARAIGPGLFPPSIVGPGGTLRRRRDDLNAGLSLADTEGKRQSPLAVDEGRINVIVFITADCPISNSYAPELAALAKDLAGKPATIYLVHTERDLSPAKAAAHAKEYGLAMPVLLDPERRLVGAVGATVTPEAAVITHGGKIAYLGRIDDRNPALGVRKPEASQRDLRDAIDAALGGRTIAIPRTKAVGCIME